MKGSRLKVKGERLKEKGLKIKVLGRSDGRGVIASVFALRAMPRQVARTIDDGKQLSEFICPRSKVRKRKAFKQRVLRWRKWTM